jgi:hypothetical protein
MTRFFRILWCLWLLGSLAWLTQVWATAPIRPTLGDLGLLLSDARPPLSEFLTDPSLSCEINLDSVTERSTHALGDRIRIDIETAPRPPSAGAYQTPEDYHRAFAEWEHAVALHSFNRSLDGPAPGTFLCTPGPYTEAVQAHHAATRPWRAASARLNNMLWPAIKPPLIALALGLFLFWAPFRRR